MSLSPNAISENRWNNCAGEAEECIRRTRERILDKIREEKLDGRQLPAYLQDSTADYHQATTIEDKLKILGSMVFLSSTNDKAKQQDVMTFLRRVLLDDPSLSSEVVVQIGGHFTVFVMLLMSEDFQLHLEAACVLNMLVASAALEIDVAEQGDVPIFDKFDLVKLLLKSSSDDIRNQALYGMAITKISKGIWDEIHQGNLDGLQLPAALEATTADYRHATTEAEKLKILKPILVSVSTTDKTKQLHLMTALRRLLLVDPILPSDVVVQIGGCVSIFVKLLMNEDSHLHFEAACVLNMLVASGALEINVTEDQDVPIFNIFDLVKVLLTSSIVFIRKQALLGICSAAVLPSRRDFLLNNGAMTLILSQNVKNEDESNEDESYEHESLVDTVAFAISCMCMGHPRPPFEQTKLALPALENFVLKPTNSDVLGYACEALSYIYDGTTDEIEINPVVCKTLVDCLVEDACPQIRKYALRTIGNIIYRDPSQTKAIISDYGALTHLPSYLNDSYVKFKLEACQFIYKITARKEEEWIQSVIDAQLISPLLTLLQTPETDVKKQTETDIKNQNQIERDINRQSAETEIKKKAVLAICNATSGGTHDQIKYLVSRGCIKPLCDLLISPDPMILTLCLEALENILQAGESEKNLVNGDINEYAQLNIRC